MILRNRATGMKVRGALLRADMLQLYPVEVNFAACLELTGLRVLFTDASLSLHLRCRLLRELRRPLVCVCQAVDDSNAILPQWRVPLESASLLSGGRRGDEILVAAKVGLPQPFYGKVNEVQFAFCDATTGICLPVCATSLPPTAEYTMVRAGLNELPSVNLLYRFGWPVLQSCRVVLEGGLELVAHSLQSLEELVWVRLKWNVSAEPRRRLAFLGCVVPSEDGGAAAPPTLKQEMVPDASLSMQILEQNLVRRVPGAHRSPVVLRGSIVDLATDACLQVLDSSLPHTGREDCFLLPFQECSALQAASPTVLLD